MGNDLVPFGKYKDQPVEIMLADHGYVDWLLSQGWFKERYVTIYNVVAGGGQEPTCTPEHNRMQMKFLDWDYRRKFVRRCMPMWHCKEPFEEIKEEHNISKFELSGMDVAIRQRWLVSSESAVQEKIGKLRSALENEKDWVKSKDLRENLESLEYALICPPERLDLAVELKPTIGDDFPDVMRQIKQRAEVARRTVTEGTFGGYSSFCPYQMLVVGEYTGVGATLHQFAKFFHNENIAVLFEHEIEQFVPTAIAPCPVPLPGH